MKKRLFIFAGEPSGDLHGADLMQDLDFEFFGVGGPKMRAQGLDEILPMEAFCVMGISAVLKALPRLYRQFYQVARAILESKPDGVILIDYPGFNLRLMRYLRKQGYKGRIIQYVAPSVWAHGKKRADHLAKYADLLLVLYPFEKAHFPKIEVHYIGNPLLKSLKKPRKKKPLIALFPGSRGHEIKANLPALKEVALRIQEKHPKLEIAISAASEKAASLIGEPVRFDTHTLMEEASLALAVSGTVTLELALRETPTLVCYKVPRLMHFVARWIARVDLEHFCIVNILMNRRLLPEFYSVQLDIDAMEQAAEELLKKNPELSEIRKALEGGEEAASVITQLLEQTGPDCDRGSDRRSCKACAEA